MVENNRTENKEFCIDSLKPPETVPYFIYRLETGRHIKSANSWKLVAIIAILVCVLSNALWIWRESQFVDEEYTIEANTDNGGTAVANASGEVSVYGNSENND